MDPIEPDRVFTEREWERKNLADMLNTDTWPVELPGEPV